MSELEHYDDPTLAARTRGWMQAAAPIAAPERLVFAVMDDVERLPRRGRLTFPQRRIVTGFVRYAALTLVIAIGVTAGILVSRTLDEVGPPTPGPSPTPTMRLIGGFQTGGRLLASNTNRAWLVAAGKLVPIAADGTLGEAIALAFAPSDLVALSDSAIQYGGAETVWLVAPDADLLRIDPSVGELIATPGARGERIALGAGAAWVGQTDRVQKVAANVMLTSSTFDVPGHRATDPILVAGDAVWIGTASDLVRLDLSTGVVLGRVSVVPSELVSSRGVVWVAEGSRLLGMDPSTGDTALTASVPVQVAAISALATHGDTVWLATSAPGGPLLIGIDPATGLTTSMTPLPSPAISIAVVGNQVWTLDSGGYLSRFEPG